MAIQKQQIKQLRYIVWIALAMMCGLWLMTMSMTQELDVIDERPHALAGYAMAWHGDARWNIEHPVLVKLISGFGARLGETAFPHDALKTMDGYEKGSQWTTGEAWFVAEGGNLPRMLWWARLPNTVLWYVVLCVSVAVFARKAWGRRAAGFAATFAAFSPLIMAHARYVTTDVAAAATAVAGVTAIWLWARRPTYRGAAVAGAVLALGLVSKYSLVLLIPLYAAAALYVWWKRRNNKGLKTMVGHIALIGAVATVVVYAVTAFGMRNMSSQNIAATVQAEVDGTELVAAIDAMPHVAQVHWVFGPIAWYVTGFASAAGRAIGGSTAYVWGHAIDGSVWWYFPAMILTKATIPLLILTLSSVVVLCGALCRYVMNARKLSFVTQSAKGPSKDLSMHVSQASSSSVGTVTENMRSNRFYEWLIHMPHKSVMFILCAASVFVGAGVSSQLNIGIRHVLPAFPFFFLLAAWVLDRIWETSRAQSRWRYGLRLGCVVLVLTWHIGAGLSAYPGYLSYANTLFGQQNAWKYMNDSNADWGQEMYRLIRFADSHDIQKVSVLNFGVWHQSVYDALGSVRLTPLVQDQAVEGFVAVSASCYLPGDTACGLQAGWQEALHQRGRLLTIIEGAMLVFYVDPA